MIQRIRDWFKKDTLQFVWWEDDNRRLCSSAGRIRIDPMFAWYDFWIGVFVDTENRRIYVFPVPMIGFKIYWGR